MAPAGASPPSLDALCIDAVRVLSMDAVQQANSGHPGTPMALAPLCTVLWRRHLRHNPADPAWPGRDRFVLSCGHASMLLYSLLHLSGYDLPLDDLRRFRQWGSRTPGHPERGHTPGVETTTGPLGQGVGNAVGMALAAAHLRALFDRDGHAPLPQRVWFVASDGDLMEGVAHEAASLAGHLRLGRLIGFFDDNRITIEGATSLACSDDVARRFEAYGWRTLHVEDGNDVQALDRAMIEAQAVEERPTLILVRTQIAWGSPNKQGSAEAHGAPLGADEVRRTKANLGWPSLEPFHVPEDVRRAWRQCRERGAHLQAAWVAAMAAYRAEYADAATELERRLRGDLPADWDDALPAFGAGDAVATRTASGKVLNAIAARVPELVGGAADLAPSTNTLIQSSGDLAAGDHSARNVRFGIREHGMGAVLNGMALHGGVRPYGATFLVFSDYMRPAIRMAALMRLDVVYVFTHDSIGLGEDGPTHQPVETLAALRAIPGLVVVRPADAAETTEAWRFAVRHRDGPVALVLTRQKVPSLDRARLAPAAGLVRGAYVLSDPPGQALDVLLLASGSEVALALAAQEELARDGIAARVVSAPSLELFAAETQSYRDEVLPPGVRARVAVEAAHPMPWYRWVGDGVLGIESFGASAPYERLYAEYGLTPAHVAARARAQLAR